MLEDTIDINAITEIRCKTTNYLGINAITKIEVIAAEIKKKGISKILVVTGKNSYKISGAWYHVEKALITNGISYDLYDGVTPNPEVDQVDQAVVVGKKLGAQAVIGIGGGSPIDVAKSTAILLVHPEKNARELFESAFTPEKALPVIAINLTHGTGTEVNRFAVVSIPEKEFKPAIAYDIIYPMYSIDDPALMTSLPAEQTRYVSIDAVNHAIEAATAKTANAYSILLATETIRLVVKYLPIVEKNPGDLTARYFLTYASTLAGISFDNGLLHITHALEHVLSGINAGIIHGHGLALLMPAVLKQIYPEKGKALANILAPVTSGLKGTPDESDKVADDVRKWLVFSGVPSGLKTLGFMENDVSRLTDLALNTPSLGLLLSLSPADSGKSAIETIYRESL